MKKIIFLITVIFCAPGAFAAQTAGLTLFEKANELYAQGQYDKAAGVYETVIQQNGPDAFLYYDLGNAYYKTQRYGKAVACFERAARLKPRDPDIRFNLNFLRTIVKEPGEPFPEIIISSLNGLLALNELTLICSVCYFMLFLGVILYIATKRQDVLILNIILAVLVVILFGWFLLKLDREVLTREAIVVAGPAEVRNGPGTENSIGFSLPEGRKVMMLGSKDGWSAIGLRIEGLKGWLETKYLEEI